MDETVEILKMLEEGREHAPMLYERDDVFLAMIQERSDIEEVSCRKIRIPVDVR